MFGRRGKMSLAQSDTKTVWGSARPAAFPLDRAVSPNPQSHLPITRGRLLDFPDDALAVMLRLHRTHGDIAAFEEGNQRLVFVFHPEYNRQVLTDLQRFHSRFWSIRGPKNSAQRRLTNALLGMNGAEHKRQRRIVSAPFQKQSI